MEKQNNSDQGFGIAGLVIGVFAVLFSFIPCVGMISIILGILAIIFGAMSLSRAQENNMPKGSGIAGVTLGGISMVIAILWLVFLFGAKDRFKDKFEDKIQQFQGWTDDLEELEEDLNDAGSLDELEKALDDLEGALDNVNVEVEVAIKSAKAIGDTALEKAKEEVESSKQAIEQAKKR